uniref:Uncharacterized protein n=1 Tax=Rhizophora mucronata TaxID=61149 RepID=A0A2P2PBQ5_RHIMU
MHTTNNEQTNQLIRGLLARDWTVN